MKLRQQELVNIVRRLESVTRYPKKVGENSYEMASTVLSPTDTILECIARALIVIANDEDKH